MEGKRIVFSNATPNDQGGIIPNDSIDFKRFHANPVVLCQHDWYSPPLGLMTDIKMENGKWTGIPVFHGITKESKEYKDMYDGGWLKACSIGGDAEWKTNAAGQPILKDGFRQCERFNLYEISMVTLPSNQDAVTLSAMETAEAMAPKVYDKTELQTISDKIVTLSSQYKLPDMTLVKTVPPAAAAPDNSPEAVALAAADKTLAEAQAAKERAEQALALKLATGGNNTKEDPSISSLPGIIREMFSGVNGIVSLFRTAFGPSGKPTTALEGAPAVSGEPASSGPADFTKPQPGPTGLEAAKKKAEDARAAAEKAAATLQTAKDKADMESASKEDKDAHSAAFAAYESAMSAALAAEEAYKSCMDSDGDTDLAAGAEPTALAGTKPATKPAAKPAAGIVKKTLEQLAAEGVTLAPKPSPKPKVNAMKGTTFSQLSAGKAGTEEWKIINRTLSANSTDGQKTLEDYQVVLQSIIDDGKWHALTTQLRVIQGVDETKLSNYMAKNTLRKERNGLGCRDIMADLQAGRVDILGRDGQLRKMTQLTSTDNALAAPALNTIEWLSLAIFNLFPSSSWKEGITMFPAEMTGRNTGLIWANIAADPAIYRGAQPAIPNADYSYTDDAVSLSLIPYWLQPMVWTPLTMHQLRYDQMSTGWAQAFAKWGAVMDDELIYILASTVPAASVILSSGQKGNNVKSSFSLVDGTPSPDNFILNPHYTGSLATPAYNDILTLEQLFNNQDYVLAKEKVRLVVDSVMEKYLKQDPDTKSLLTRWIESDKNGLLKISNTELVFRSKVAAYDQATGQVKDPTGVIASTVMSAALYFLCSQVAIGLGMLDVFMLQDPGAYGFRMSADIRIGAVPVRKSFKGTGLYTYGTPNV